MIYSAVKLSSGWSASSTIRSKPLVSNVCTFVIACKVRPKCRPWWTRGSDIHLLKVSEDGCNNHKTHGFFLAPIWSVEPLFGRPVETEGASCSWDM
jgi:hypothetical protein